MRRIVALSVAIFLVSPAWAQQAFDKAEQEKLNIYVKATDAVARCLDGQVQDMNALRPLRSCQKEESAFKEASDKFMRQASDKSKK